MKTKKLVALVLVAVLAITSVVGTTLAYFTDTDKAENVFAIGNVKIELIEEERKEKTNTDGTDYTENNLQEFDEEETHKLFPIGSASNKYLDKNYVDKIVTVKNNGTEDAYIRTIYAIPVVRGYDEKDNQSNNWFHWNVFSASDDEDPTDGWYWGKPTEENKNQKNKYGAPYAEYPDVVNDWNSIKGDDGKPVIFDIGGSDYMIYIGTNINIIKAKEVTDVALRGVFLDKDVDYDADKGVYTMKGEEIGDISNLKVLVFAQAVQADGFADAWEAFEKSGLPENPWA